MQLNTLRRWFYVVVTERETEKEREVNWQMGKENSSWLK